jgi:antirestriction protein
MEHPSPEHPSQPPTEHASATPKQPEQQPEQPADATVEREPRSDTRIYVASLSDYNAGRLHGTWIDTTADADDLAEEVQAMLARSPVPGAEEWAIHDYEGFGPLRLDEYEDLATISQIGHGIAEHGRAFAHWAAITGTSDRDELARFDDVYLGHWDSVEAYAEELLDDLGLDNLIERAVPDHLRSYVTVNVEGFARDLEYSGDVTASEGDGGVYLFDQTR